MKHLGALIIILMLVTITIGPVNVSAKTISISDSIEVRSQVLGMHTIIVNDKNTIIEISSNTVDNPVPRVFRNRIAKDNIVPITEDIYRNYRKIVPEGQSRVGVLYKFYQFPVLTRADVQSYSIASLLAMR